MIEIKSLIDSTAHEIFEAFNKAFANYEMQLDQKELWAMFKRRGFNPELSFAAFHNGHIVSFTCNGTGNFNGVYSAYDTGTGTLEEYRGQGLATRIFQYSIPYLKEAGIQQYLLEVLQHNTSAVSVYTKLGFTVTREFNYFRQECEAINKTVNLDLPYHIKPIDTEQYTDVLREFQDFPLSWQNSIESVRRSADSFIYLGAFAGERLVGYGIFEPASGDVTQLAVDKHHRRKGIGSLLFRKMLEANKHHSVKVINTAVEYDSVTCFLKSWNIDISGKQFEMIKPFA